MMQFDESPTAVMTASGEQETLSVSDLSRCRSCGTTLARDQRYCLNCGKSSAERPAAPQQSAPPANAAAAPASGGITPGMAAAGVCLSVLFLAAGVLVGRNSGASQTAAAPAAAPIVVQSSGGGSGTSAATDGSTAPAPTDSSSTPGGASTPSASAPPPKLNAADKAKQQKAAQQLSQLNKLSGKDYSKQSAKLPKQYVAPGKLPAPDGGQAGGGSSATTIG